MPLAGVWQWLSRNSKALGGLAALVVVMGVVPVIWRWAERNLGSDLDVQEEWNSATIPPDMVGWANRVGSSLSELADFERRRSGNQPFIPGLDDLVQAGQSETTSRLVRNRLTPDEGLLVVRIQNNLNDAAPEVRLRVAGIANLWRVRLGGDFLDQSEVRSFDSSMDAQNTQSDAIIADLPTIPARGFVTVSIYGDGALSEVSVSAPGHTVRIRKVVEVTDSTLISMARDPFSFWFFGCVVVWTIFVGWMWSVGKAVQSSLPSTLYGLACEDAKAGKTASAIALLTKAFESGYSDKGHARADVDLSSLRALPEFRSLVGE